MLKSTGEICCYKYCRHVGKKITGDDEFVSSGKKFYHKDCFQAKEDIQYIKNLWLSNISQTVSIPLLYKVINEYVERGVTTAYIAFVMEYIIRNHCKLNYPPGLRYYIDNADIKKKYEKKLAGSIPADSFIAFESQEDAPKKSYSLPKRASGFASILDGDK